MQYADIVRLNQRLKGLVVFRNILKNDVVGKLGELLDLICGEQTSTLLELTSCIAAFEAALFEHDTNWTSYLLQVVLDDENPYVYSCASKLRQSAAAELNKQQNPSNIAFTTLEKCALSELSFFNSLGALTLGDIAHTITTLGEYEASNTSSSSNAAGSASLDASLNNTSLSNTSLSSISLDNISLDASAVHSNAALDFLTPWQTKPVDFVSTYKNRVATLPTLGYGIFARYNFFVVEHGALTPVLHPDAQNLEDLPGYESERSKIIENTKALLKGLPANNILLYGDAGTGKSSSVKAIANAFAKDGLRLVEVKKNQLYELPKIMDDLAQNPLKFIVFIDDLSFDANDKDFAALKAILEGSVLGNANNVVIYATSNRRHLVKETHEDRQGSDIHMADTRQELMSLSARFGLIVTFLSPDKKRYAKILNELAQKAGLDIAEDELITRAEAFAIRAGGRSPRVAKHFIDLLQAGIDV